MAPYQLVVVGTSLGGLDALKVLLSGLPAAFSLPITLAQHRDPNAPAGLAHLLQRYCPLPLSEVEDKQAILPGRVYLAPAGYHLLVEAGSFALSTESPVHFARPSIDVLFESAADTYGAAVIGVALTGSSQDGAAGLARIAARGGLALVQDPATAQSPALPLAALAATPAARVLPLDRIAVVLAGLATGMQEVRPA